MNPLLSILIPTVPERSVKLAKLLGSLEAQAINQPVEILTFGDNRKRSIGMKRQALLDLARGKYVAFCDDDDMISSDYVATLCDIAKRVTVSVICFNQEATWNGEKSIVEFRIDHDPFAPFVPGGATKRFPWHVCAWHRKIAQQCIFTDKQWGEDADWVAQAYALAETQAFTDKVLHYYTHTDADSLAIDKAA